eukprot:gene37239-44605_t
MSVISTAKGRPRLLARALASAVAEEGAAFEIVVVDDGAGDGLAQAEALADPRVRAVSSGMRGQVPARVLGVATARGDRIAFLDDDDWWAGPDHLARLSAAMTATPALAYASGSVVVEDADMQPIDELPFISAATVETLARDNTLIVSGLLYHRRLHDDLGTFDVGSPYYWDWDWYLRVARAGVPLLNSGGSAVRISARHGSVSSDANIAARRADLDRLQAKHGLEPIPLRNHESIARDRRQGS